MRKELSFARGYYRDGHRCFAQSVCQRAPCHVRMGDVLRKERVFHNAEVHSVHFLSAYYYVLQFVCPDKIYRLCYLVFSNLALTEWASGFKSLPHKAAD